MAYYDNSSAWSPAPGRQASWEQPTTPSRPGTTPTGALEEPDAFFYQLANVDRAVETWRKAGKTPSDNRMMGNQRHHSMNDFDGMRPHSGGNLQNFYSNQRFAGRPGDNDQAVQAKRRMAAQRERELRNYHQEQQYQKHLSSAKSDRSMSPNTGMSEDERRELIARQHRALYGSDSSLYPTDTATSRPLSQDARVTAGNLPSGLRGASPLAFDPFGMQPGVPGNSADPVVTMPSRDGKDVATGSQRSRANSNSSPSSNQNTTFSVFDSGSSGQQQQQQSSRTSNSSPGESPTRSAKPSTSAAGSVAPIGTRPNASQSNPQPGNIQKRSTTPLPSPLSYGFSANEQGQGEKTVAAGQDEKVSGLRGAWGNSGVWGGKGSLGVQAKVWG